MLNARNNILYYLFIYYIIITEYGHHSINYADATDEDLSEYNATFWLFNRDTVESGVDLGPYPNYYWNVDMIGVKQRDTKVLVHGWFADRFSRFSIELKDVYLNELDVNVILVDWGSLAKQSYSSAMENLNVTAQHITHFIQYLITDQNISPNRIHFIGYGLGSHLAGLACKNLKPKISAITALDPISLMCKLKPKERLSSQDAQFVEVIHTGSRKFIGPTVPLGHADFFPNGGKLQPGCGLDLLASCSGERAIDLFVSSIKSNGTAFVGVRCHNVLEAIQQRCSSMVKGRMGGKTISRKYGIYSLKTTDKAPFY